MKNPIKYFCIFSTITFLEIDFPPILEIERTTCDIEKEAPGNKIKSIPFSLNNKIH